MVQTVIAQTYKRSAFPTKIVQKLRENYLNGVPHNMDGPLAFLNSDYIVFLYIKEVTNGHNDILIDRLRQDPMHKLDFAFMRLHTGFLSVEEFGKVPVKILTLQFLAKCAIWSRYEKESEDGHDYDLKKSLLRRHLPVSLVNQLFFSQSTADSVNTAVVSGFF